MSRHLYPARYPPPNRGFLPPPCIDGHLYYVRLRTAIGPVYKLGFTTLPSMRERLAFKGDGAEKLIDKVLLFQHVENAWGLEQELHALFEPEKLFPCGTWQFMPLYKNGQSELYGEDVLRLDVTYSEQQLEDVKDNIVVLESTWNGRRDADDVRAEIAERRLSEKRRAQGWVRPPDVVISRSQHVFESALALVFKPLAVLWSLIERGLPKPPKPWRDLERMKELRKKLKDFEEQQSLKASAEAPSPGH